MRRRRSRRRRERRRRRRQGSWASDGRTVRVAGCKFSSISINLLFLNDCHRKPSPLLHPLSWPRLSKSHSRLLLLLVVVIGWAEKTDAWTGRLRPDKTLTKDH